MEKRKRLGDLLIDEKMITKSDLDKALRLQVGGNRRLGYLLIKMGFISEEQLHSVLSKQMDLPIIEIEKEITNSTKKILPRYLCKKYSVIPLGYGENNTLNMAMVDPSDADAVADIEKYTGKVIRPVLASKSDISTSIGTHIPWSLKDIFNAQTSSKVTAVAASIALLLVMVTATQFYKDRQEVKFGKVTRTGQMVTYENLELIVGFDKDNTISLLGRGAHSPGYYSVTFDDAESLKSFLHSKKDGFSEKQLDWLDWAINNPKKSD